VTINNPAVVWFECDSTNSGLSSPHMCNKVKYMLQVTFIAAFVAVFYCTANCFIRMTAMSLISQAMLYSLDIGLERDYSCWYDLQRHSKSSTCCHSFDSS